MSWLPVRMKKIQLKMKALECSQDFSDYRSMGNFPDAQGAGNSAVQCRIWSDFELIRDFIVVLVTYENEENPIEKVGSRVFTKLDINFSDDMQGQITLELAVVSGRNLNSSKLSCMSSLPARMRLTE